MNTYDNTIAFLEKAKKQAKKLFKISKENNLKVEINNLSESQHLIAKIYGYTDWHSLNKSLKNVLTKENEEDYIVNSSKNSTKEIIFLSEFENLHYLSNETHLTSFFELTSFPSSSHDEAYSWISNIKKKLAFKWNMEFHRLNILFDFYKEKEEENPISEDYIFFQWNNSLGLTQEQFNELFSINLKPHPKGFCLRVLCSASTLKEQNDEHLLFCNDLGKYFSNKNSISKSELILLNSNDESSKININKIIFDEKKSQENLNWLYGLQTLYQKKTPIKLLAHISHKEYSLEIIPSEHDEPQNKFLKGLLSSLNKQIYDNFEVEEDIQLSFNVDKTIVPWNEGIPFINKSDKSIIEIKLNTPYQTSSVNFIYAKPGSGKSSLLNILNIDNALGQAKISNGELPNIGIVDIGPSSKGTIDFFQHCLLKDKKEQALYHRLSNQDIINPFDTEIGCRQPNYLHNLFLNDFILLLILPKNKNDLNYLTELVNSVIQIVYEENVKKPKLYSQLNEEPSDIEYALNNTGYKTNNKTSWWNVVDALFSQGYLKEAKLAQRYAVPVLEDILTVFQDVALQDIYGKSTLSTGETLIQYFKRSIVDAINKYQNLNSPTVFDLGEARIICLDLDEMARTGSFEGQKQTAAMYSIASFVLSKHFNLYFLAASYNRENIPDIYQEYYNEEFKNKIKISSSICFDEYHRVSDFYPIEKIITNYLRESRKYGFIYNLSTQSLTNVENIVQFSSNFFLFPSSFDNKAEKQKIISMFNIKDSKTISYLKNDKNIEFGDLLFKANTNQGNIEKIISLKINPQILWMTSSTIENSYIRSLLSKKMGYFEAIKLLAQKYPKGVKQNFEQIKENEKTLSMDEIVQKILTEL